MGNHVLHHRSMLLERGVTLWEDKGNPYLKFKVKSNPKSKLEIFQMRCVKDLAFKQLAF